MTARKLAFAGSWLARGGRRLQLILKLRIAHSLPLVVVGAALVASAAIGFGSYVISAATVTAMAEAKLLTVGLERSRDRQGWLERIGGDLVTTAAAPTTIQAFGEIQMSFGVTKAAARGLQEGYIANNPIPPDARELLVAS